MNNNLFSVKDAYCVFLLKEKSIHDYKFSTKNSKHISQRGQTRFLFYCVVIQFISDILSTKFVRKARKEIETKLITSVLLQLFRNGKVSILLDNAVQLIDEYMTKTKNEDDKNIFNELWYKDDLNAFLKIERLHEAVKLNYLIRDYVRVMKRISNKVVPYDEIANGIKIKKDE